jgi:hypothetical protein
VYHITVSQTAAENAGMTVTIDGVERDDHTIPLADDRQEHRAEVRIQVAPSQNATTVVQQTALA